MRTILWVTRPEMNPFAGAQHEAMQQELRGLGWQVTTVTYQQRLLWRHRGTADVLMWTFVPSQLEVWLAKRIAGQQFGLIHELGTRQESLPTLDHWFTPSECLRAGLTTRGVDRGDISVAPLVPPLTPAATVDVRQELGLPAGTTLLYSAGPLVPQTGNRIAVWALNIVNYLHPDVHLVLHGEGAERERLEHFSSSIDDRRRVHFVPASWSTSDLVTQSNQVWLPRQSEGVPDALFLALQTGKPIVASRLQGFARWLRHEHNALLASPTEPAEWAIAARRLLEQPALATALAAAARRTPLTSLASQDGDWRRQFEQVEAARPVLAA